MTCKETGITPQLFLSTLSLRRATFGLLCRILFRRISIHALLAESDENGFAGVLFLIDISIHALLAESDYMCPIISTTTLIISIHALLAESDTAQ